MAAWHLPVAMSTARKSSKKTAVKASAPIKGPPSEAERRAGSDRREDVDRRAFWRPTPDRRREERELGRRTSDGSTG